MFLYEKIIPILMLYVASFFVGCLDDKVVVSVKHTNYKMCWYPPGAYQTDIDSTILNLLHAFVVKQGCVDSVFENMKK